MSPRPRGPEDVGAVDESHGLRSPGQKGVDTTPRYEGMKFSQSTETKAISNLVEAELRASDGQLLGIVDELLIDLHTGRIEYVLAAGVRGQRLQFPWSSITLDDRGFKLVRSGPRLVTGGVKDPD